MMPIYEFFCRECDKVVEINLRITNSQEIFCPICKSPMKKLISSSSFILKGNCWAKDNYTYDNKKPKNKDLH